MCLFNTQVRQTMKKVTYSLENTIDKLSRTIFRAAQISSATNQHFNDKRVELGFGRALALGQWWGEHVRWMLLKTWTFHHNVVTIYGWYRRWHRGLTVMDSLEQRHQSFLVSNTMAWRLDLLLKSHPEVLTSNLKPQPVFFAARPPQIACVASHLHLHQGERPVIVCWWAATCSDSVSTSKIIRCSERSVRRRAPIKAGMKQNLERTVDYILADVWICFHRVFLGFASTLEEAFLLLMKGKLDSFTPPWVYNVPAFITVELFVVSITCDIWFLCVGEMSDASTPEGSRSDVTDKRWPDPPKSQQQMNWPLSCFPSALLACPLPNEQELICGSSLG